MRLGYRILEFGIYPSTMLRVVSLSNHLLFGYCDLVLQSLGLWRYFSLLSARMILGMHLLEMLSGNMSVNLRC
jgi:hypothetical protein